MSIDIEVRILRRPVSHDTLTFWEEDGNRIVMNLMIPNLTWEIAEPLLKRLFREED